MASSPPPPTSSQLLTPLQTPISPAAPAPPPGSSRQFDAQQTQASPQSLASPHPLVSIVLLSYARPSLLERSLKAIAAQTYARIELILIDNRSSRSEEVSRLASQYPDLRFVPLPDNRGFTGGMNEGIRLASGEMVLLTEDDIELAPDAIEQWVRRLLQPGGLRVICSGLIWERPSGELNFAGGEIRLGSQMDLRLLREAPPSKDPYETGYIPGSLVFLHASALRDLRGFRPDFFMYVEDVEFCLRARSQGYRLEIVPLAEAKHWGKHVPYDEVDRAPVAIEIHKFKNLLSTYLDHASPLRSASWIASTFFWEILVRGRKNRTRVSVVLRALLWHLRKPLRRGDLNTGIDL